MSTRLPWPVLFVAAVILVFGVVMGCGGAWLVALGGSAYYLLAGIGLVASGVLLWRGRREGALLYFAIFALTVAWALWEVGLDGWALVPRLLALAVLALAIAFMFPWLHHRSGEVK